MSDADTVPVEVGSTGETMDQVDGASADSENAVTEFSTKTCMDDLTLVVDNRQLFVCKSVLALASPVFRAMFSDEFQEKGKQEITLPGKKFDDIVEFLKCIYPSIMKPVTMDNVFDILPLANEYQAQPLKSACEVCLLSHLSGTRDQVDVFIILELVCLYNLEQVQEKCVDIIATRPHEEFDEAVDKFSFSADVQLRIKALSTTYKEECVRIKTHEALCRFLGDMTSQRDICGVVGDFVRMRVSSKFDSTAKLNIGDSTFAISLRETYSSHHQSMCVFTKIECQTQIVTNCLGIVFIHNWMQGKEDIKEISKFQFSSQKHANEIILSSISPSSLRDETAGYIYKNSILSQTAAMDVHVYLFCIDEQ